LRGTPVIVVQTPTDSAVAAALPEPHPGAGQSSALTNFHERFLKAIVTCLPVYNVMSIDKMACHLMGTERQVD
jgi:hypothetical protein